MRRHPLKKRRFTTKLKHRLKLNARYDPRRRIRMTFTEIEYTTMTRILKRWSNMIFGDVQNENPSTIAI